MRNLPAVLLTLALLAATPATGAAPHASHVTLVMMENRDNDLIAGNPQAPYFNNELVPQGVMLRNSHAVTHPSEPNYLAVFSGSTHGVTSDACPVSFASANAASELFAAGKTFVGYAESMPRDGFAGCYSDDLYARKHDPWVDFTNVPPAANLVYRGFPAGGAASFVWITPNLCNDMHDCSARIGDAWLSKNLPPIIAWNRQNDGLLIVTWDEADPDADGTNHIPTVLVGPMIRAGTNDVQFVDHYTVLRTIETIFGLPCIAQECKASVIQGVWK
jgi:acid phosphatase